MDRGLEAQISQAATHKPGLIQTLDHLCTGFAWAVSSAFLAGISLLGLWQVVSRFVLTQPSSWTEEVMRRMLIWCVLLGVVVAFRNGALVSVDLMIRKARGNWRRFVRWTITGASLAYLIVVLWFGAVLTWRVRLQTFASIELSMAWAYAALPVSAALAIVAVLAHHLDPRNQELDSAQ